MHDINSTVQLRKLKSRGQMACPRPSIPLLQHSAETRTKLTPFSLLSTQVRSSFQESLPSATPLYSEIARAQHCLQLSGACKKICGTLLGHPRAERSGRYRLRSMALCLGGRAWRRLRLPRSQHCIYSRNGRPAEDTAFSVPAF